MLRYMRNHARLRRGSRRTWTRGGFLGCGPNRQHPAARPDSGFAAKPIRGASASSQSDSIGQSLARNFAGPLPWHGRLIKQTPTVRRTHRRVWQSRPFDLTPRLGQADVERLKRYAHSSAPSRTPSKSKPTIDSARRVSRFSGSALASAAR